MQGSTDTGSDAAFGAALFGPRPTAQPAQSTGAAPAPIPAVISDAPSAPKQQVPLNQAPVEQLRPDFESMETRAFGIDDDDVRAGVMRNIERLKTQYTLATQADKEKTKQDLINASEQLARGADVPLIGEDHIRHLFPKDGPGGADDLIEKQRDSQLIGSALNSIRTKSFADLMKDMNAIEQGIGLPGVHDVTLRERGEKAYLAAAHQYLAGIFGDGQRPGDPVGTFVQTPELRDDADQLSKLQAPQTPDGWTQYTAQHEAFAQKMLGYEDHFGLTPDMRHILSADQAANIGLSLTQDPANARATLNSLSQTWGSAWPQVWSDITHYAKLPTSYQALGVLDDHSAMRLAQGLNDERGGEPGEKKGMEVWNDRFGSQKTTGPDGVITAVRGNELVQSLLKSMPTASAPQINSMLHAIDTLAFSYMARDDMADNIAGAVDKAVHAFTDLYEFMPQGGARVPKAQFEAVNSSARALIDNLTPTKIMIPRGIGDYAGAPTAQDYVENIKANPIWINGKDGVELIDPLRARRVLGSDGYPITVPFNVRPPPLATQPASATAPAAVPF